jgi:hypothetical protein
VDKILVDLLSQYMTKMGSVTEDTKTILSRMYRHIDRQDQTKVASVAAQKDRAGVLAHKLSTTRLISGAPLIEGYESIKQAAVMLSDHDQALNVLDMVLDSVAASTVKHASVEPGYPCNAPVDADKLSADDWLVSQVLGPQALNKK